MAVSAGRRFWMVATAVIIVFTIFVVGRNLLHAVDIRRQINALEREGDYYREKIARDSALLEQLRYDEGLERYAREHYHMQREGEHVYMLKE